MPVDEIHGSHGLFKCAAFGQERWQGIAHSAVVISERRHVITYDMEHPEDQCRPPDLLRQFVVTGVQHRDNLLQISILSDVPFRKCFPLNKIKHQNTRRMVHHGGRQAITDQTDRFAVLSVMGPRSRELLARAAADQVDDAALPFAAARQLRVGTTSVTAIRLTYVGELGYELHVPVDEALTVYQALMSAGADLGIRNAGYRAIESLRLEKGYRAWSSDLSPDHTPLEAGLAWAVKLNCETDFLGRAALLQQQGQGLKKKLACFTADDNNVNLIGRETLYRNEQRVGWLTSAGYGHTVDCPIGFGYVRNPDGIDQDYLERGDYSLEVAGVRVPCTIHFKPLYDPAMSRVRN